MRVSIGALALALATVGFSGAASAQQLREDSYRWYVGPQAGVLRFETQTQDGSFIPSVGAHALIMGKRGGLLISIEESFGSDETSAYADSDAPNGARAVTFDRLRKYSAILMAYPIRARVEPFLGVGFGVLHTVGTQVQGFFTDPDDAAFATEIAKDLGSTGFGSLVAGVQVRLAPNRAFFGQWQVTTSPSAGSLLVGPTNALMVGLRFGLGSAKEGVRGGGY